MNMISKLRRIPLIGLAILFVTCGCGGTHTGLTDELPRHPVSGNLKVDGAPLAGVTLRFIPTGTTDGQGGFARTDEEGNFTAISQNQKPGLPEGQYNVTFSKRVMPDGSPIAPGDMSAAGMSRELMPPSFTQVAADSPIQKHPYRVMVNGATTDVKLEIQPNLKLK